MSGFGSPAYDVSHVLGGLMLLLSFVLLYQRRIAAVIGAFALQGAALAAAAAWQAHVQGAHELWLTALIRRWYSSTKDSSSTPPASRCATS